MQVLTVTARCLRQSRGFATVTPRAWRATCNLQRRATKPDRDARPRPRRPRMPVRSDAFVAAVRSALDEISFTLSGDKMFEHLQIPDPELHTRYQAFRASLVQRISTEWEEDKSIDDLLTRFKIDDHVSMRTDIKIQFFSELLNGMDRPLEDVAYDLRHPTEWFPSTRGIRRKFHLHVGPTNSGKTYHALKRLEAAQTGVYAGPLRLLAHEVYQRLTARGLDCCLVTGDDRRSPDPENLSSMISCTVEMIPLGTPMDVAVIDEIQMIGHEERGWAWTQAVLGVPAKEVHLCGEDRTVPLVKELVAMCGDSLEIHRYERLTPLKMMNKSLDGDLSKLQKGDCVVCFSVNAIHSLRQSIEKTLGCKAAIIYGGLPPETRTQQAQLFNDPDNDYDILVASDAIGMGLNLSIKRIIFQTSQKMFNKQFHDLAPHEIKQIAGRAGRFSTAAQDIKNAKTDKPEPSKPVDKTGFFTTLEDFDYPIIKRAYDAAPQPIRAAGLQAPATAISRLSKYYPVGTPLSLLLAKFIEKSRLNGRFRLSQIDQNFALANSVQEVEHLSLANRLVLIAAPVEIKLRGVADLARTLATFLANRQQHTILDVPELDLDLLDNEYRLSIDYLRQLEDLNKGLVFWAWLSYRYPDIFCHRILVQHTRNLVAARIVEVIGRLSFDLSRARQLRQAFLAGKAEEEARLDAERDQQAEAVKQQLYDNAQERLYKPSRELNVGD